MAADLSHLLSVDKIKHKYETGDINSEPKEKFVIIKHQNKYLRDYALPQGSFFAEITHFSILDHDTLAISREITHLLISKPWHYRLYYCF